MRKRSRPALVFATRPGGTTIDRDAFGGNPFATALIQLSSEDSISLRRFPGRLRALTVRGSQGHQRPQWTRWPDRLRWSFRHAPGSRQERRCALVLIVSDYEGAGLAPLAGAAHDERRLSAMFAANGFSVVQSVAPSRAASARRAFAIRPCRARMRFPSIGSRQRAAVLRSTSFSLPAAARRHQG